MIYLIAINYTVVLNTLVNIFYCNKWICNIITWNWLNSNIQYCYWVDDIWDTEMLRHVEKLFCITFWVLCLTWATFSKKCNRFETLYHWVSVFGDVQPFVCMNSIQTFLSIFFYLLGVRQQPMMQPYKMSQNQVHGSPASNYQQTTVPQSPSG